MNFARIARPQGSGSFIRSEESELTDPSRTKKLEDFFTKIRDGAPFDRAQGKRGTRGEGFLLNHCQQHLEGFCGS